MKPRHLVTIALLLFVGASVIVLAVKSLQSTPPNGTAESQNSGSDVKSPADGVIVYYLHGKRRCSTCEAMEANTREAIETGFADQLAGGSLVLREIDYEATGNKHYVQDFSIPAPAPTVVVERLQGGKRETWKNLDRAFELMMTADKETFIEYVQNQTRALLAESDK